MAAGVLIIIIGMVSGPGEGGSGLLLVAVLAVIAVGLVFLAMAPRLAVRALGEGRRTAIVPLLVDAFLVFWGVIGFLGTFGRFLGWG